jgi:hypothetical protein
MPFCRPRGRQKGGNLFPSLGACHRIMPCCAQPTKQTVSINPKTEVTDNSILHPVSETPRHPII